MKKSKAFTVCFMMLMFLICVTTAVRAEEISNSIPVREINISGLWEGCAPAAAANILGYWAGEDFDIFKGVGVTTDENVTEAQVNILMNDLGYNMGTGEANGYTAADKIAPGIIKTLKDRKVKACYDIKTEYMWFLPVTNYFTIVEQIDAGRPALVGGVLVNTTSVFYRHACTVTGYRYDEGLGGTYNLIVNDGLVSTTAPVEQRWVIFPSLPFPLTLNPFYMATINLQTPDEPGCPCGIWQFKYTFKGDNEPESYANFFIYGDKTFEATDGASNYAGTWDVSGTGAEGGDITIALSIILNGNVAGVYTAALDPDTHRMVDGTMNIFITGMSGTWHADRFSGNPWDTPPVLEDYADRLHDNGHAVHATSLCPTDVQSGIQ